jgi:hypothetical protein
VSAVVRTIGMTLSGLCHHRPPDHFDDLRDDRIA